MSEKTRRGLEISITAVFVLALLLVGAVLIFSGGTASAKQFATLRLLAGQVAVQRGNGAFETGQDGTSLREGDTVRTGPDGRASIEYFDGSLTRLDFDTSFTLVTLETLGDAAASTVIEGSQAEGNSYHRVAELTDARSRFEIETPTATASVHGTGYALLVDEGSTTIAVVEGVVAARGSTGAVEIPAGEMAVVGTDGVVGTIQAIPLELLEGDWLMFNLCADHAPECVEGDGGGPEGPTEPPKGSGQGEHGSVPPTSTTGAGGEGGTTGGTPPLPPLNKPPQAGFSAAPRLGPAPLRVRFTDASQDPDGDHMSRHWSFGDGSAQSGGQTLSHTYDDPGRYTVTLTVSDPRGKQDAESKVIRVGSAEAAFDHIIISPSNATIQPGGSRSYTAEAFDSDGGSMGNVTVDTDFSIAPNGSCNGNTCTANQPGAHTVTGTYQAESDDATLMVQDEAPPPPPPPPPPQCPTYALAFHVRPPANQAAGQPFNVQIRVDVLDDGSSDGPLSINLSLQGGTFSGGETSATWTGQGIVNFDHLTIDEPGSYAISASASCATSPDPAPIRVGSAEAVFDHIIISPSDATIQPGGSRSYTAEAFDSDGGSMGNVTVDTDFSIAPNGSCNGNTCTANQPGAHTVTGTYHAESDDATLMVEDEAPPPPPPPPPPQCPTYALAFHVRPPANQAAGQPFNVQIRVDVLDDGSSDGPLSINLSLQGGTFSGGETSATWTGQGIVNFDHLTIDEPGSYAISASASCATSPDPAPIRVGSAEAVFDHIIISPSDATIQPGGSRSYTAEAFDSDGGSMGNVTVDTDFSIAPNGSCNGNTCTANQPGAHTVTGTYHAESDDATLMVEDEAPPPPPPQCPTYALAFHVRPPANQAAGQPFNVQIRVDVLDDGSSDGPLSINLSLQGGTFSGGETSATWTGQGIVNFDHLTIDEPGSYAISASASCATSPDPTPITITEGSNAGSKDGCSALGLVLAVPRIRRLRRGPRADPSRSRTPARPRT